MREPYAGGPRLLFGQLLSHVAPGQLVSAVALRRRPATTTWRGKGEGSCSLERRLVVVARVRAAVARAALSSFIVNIETLFFSKLHLSFFNETSPCGSLRVEKITEVLAL